MTFQERIAAIRKELKFSQEKFGELANVSQRTVAFWESGERMPSHATVAVLADRLDMSIDYLLGRTDVDTNIKKQPAASNDEPLRSEIIRTVNSLSEQELPVLSAFLQGMSAGKGIASASQAHHDPDQK